jgi:hypothetical protein
MQVVVHRSEDRAPQDHTLADGRGRCSGPVDRPGAGGEHANQRRAGAAPDIAVKAAAAVVMLAVFCAAVRGQRERLP